MKFLVFSDLHADYSPLPPIEIALDVDAVVAAGDTAEGARNAFETLRRLVPQRIPIVTVLGNHEPYRRVLPEEIAWAREFAPNYNIHFLENDSVVLGGSGGVRVAGCSLWTDYELFGRGNARAAMTAARLGLNDHRLITWQKKPWLRFRPEEARLLHQESRRFLETLLAIEFSGPTLVVTHHGHAGSLHPRHAHDLMSCAYLSDLTSLIEKYCPAALVHGHVHSSFDYMVGGTRLICNPRGYGRENPSFDPSMTVEIP
jgi:Icc-related predicted phosphoesterase